MSERGVPFVKGNKLWKLRTNAHKPRIFSDAAVLWAEACAYFDWCDRNPRERTELVKYQGVAYEQAVPLGRMYTVAGLCVYLGVSGMYLNTAKKELQAKQDKGVITESETAVLETIERIFAVVETEQIEGAAVQLYSPNFIARLNGLSDNTNVTSNQPIVHVSVEDKETAEMLADLDKLL